MGKERKRIKCLGRFHELRDVIVSAVDLIKTEDIDFSIKTMDDLHSVWDLIESDFDLADQNDPYFNLYVDKMRTNYRGICHGDVTLSLVPLLTEELEVTPSLIEQYLSSFNFSRKFSFFFFVKSC